MNRRQFIQDSSLTMAGMLVSPAFAASARAARRVPGANERLRIGIVGFSDRFRDALGPAVKSLASESNCEFVGVSDLWSRRRDEAVAWAEKQFGAPIQACRNNEELYEKVRPDAVIISTADFQHALHLAEAVEAGCDVYCEKPFAETMADARHALKAAKDSGRVIQIGSQRRSGAVYRAAHEYLKSGEFGPVVCVEMCWNVNQPGRWRRPALVAALKEGDTDWKRFLMNRPKAAWDPRKYLEYRLFWPYSSGIAGQWMCHQIDTVHWFSGLPHPRSVSANGGIYQWRDGRTNFDTLTAVFDYGPLDGPAPGFQVIYSSRNSNSAGGVKEIYYSNGGELNLDTRKVTSNGGLPAKAAAEMGLRENLLAARSLEGEAAANAASTGVDSMTLAHMRNWLECVRSRRQTNAPIEAGYSHSIATIMANAAARTGQRVTFDAKRQEVLAGGNVFHL